MTELPYIHVRIDRLQELVLATITAIARHVHLITGIIRDDIDNAGDRIATIQSGSGPVQDLYPLYVRHIDTGIGIIAGQNAYRFPR